MIFDTAMPYKFTMLLTVVETPLFQSLWPDIWLLLIYAKSARDNVPANVLKQIKQEIENADD